MLIGSSTFFDVGFSVFHKGGWILRLKIAAKRNPSLKNEKHKNKPSVFAFFCGKPRACGSCRLIHFGLAYLTGKASISQKKSLRQGGILSGI